MSADSQRKYLYLRRRRINTGIKKLAAGTASEMREGLHKVSYFSMHNYLYKRFGKHNRYLSVIQISGLFLKLVYIILGKCDRSVDNYERKCETI